MTSGNGTRFLYLQKVRNFPPAHFGCFMRVQLPRAASGVQGYGFSVGFEICAKGSKFSFCTLRVLYEVQVSRAASGVQGLGFSVLGFLGM